MINAIVSLNPPIFNDENTPGHSVEQIADLNMIADNLEDGIDLRERALAEVDAYLLKHSQSN